VVRRANDRRVVAEGGASAKVYWAVSVRNDMMDGAAAAISGVLAA